MPSLEQARSELLELLKSKSLFFGDFTLVSGAKSNYYFDCKLTTLDAHGAAVVGQLMHALIRREETARQVRVDAVGGLTMGADPIAVAIAIHSWTSGDPRPLQAFSVRKAPKAHGQTKMIEGNFRRGDTVAVMDDVVTRGESTIAAIQAVEKEGGKVAFIAVLVDRQEGGGDKIRSMGYPVVALFNRDELLAKTAKPS